MQCECLVGWQGPWRRGPNDHRYLLNVHKIGNAKSFLRIDLKGKFDVDRWRDVVFIFHLRLSQRGLVLRAPQHRFEAFVHPPLLHELSEFANNCRFILSAHREIGVRPISKHAQPLKFFTLDGVKLFRVLAAQLSNLRGRQIFFLGAKLLGYLMLNGQPMTIPPGNIRNVKTFHGS